LFSAKPPANNNNNNNNKNSSYNQETNDSIFLDIKKVRSDPNTKYFYNPYKTEVERMLAASELYSPGHTKREGYAIKDGGTFQSFIRTKFSFFHLFILSLSHFFLSFFFFSLSLSLSLSLSHF
jgi:hypothetical protein